MITINGQANVVRNIKAIADRLPHQAASALFRRAEAIMGDSKEHYCPVDTGNLRNSGHVELPQIGVKDISVEMGYGGPSVPYALRQHEDLSFHHDVGQAKYLETPLTVAVRTMLEDIADDLSLT